MYYRVYTRGAHFEKKIIRFGSVIHTSNNFSQGKEKRNIYQDRILNVDVQSLLCLACLLNFAEQATWALGRACASRGFV